ncbi:MAG: hypothetical protein RIB58_09420 [Phycisphaerales bacterium]
MPARRTIAFALPTLALAAAAHAQMPGEVIIEVDAPVLAPGESTTVRLWAGFDSNVDFAVAGIATSLLADSGGVDITDAWSDVGLVFPMNGPGTSSGLPVSGGYAGIIAGQLHDPFAPRFTDTSDPIAFWEATFTAPWDAGAFEVDLSTQTNRFEVYLSPDSRRSESRMAGLTEGAATIFVVPAPASAAVLALGLAGVRRRR